ncbi:MAG TPA: glycoside hydrolase family 130 protein [Bryobacteraceae bacterium]|nr:glycoside hydrolase family 130 protein [Bryobacteraceae bacterium]
MSFESIHITRTATALCPDQSRVLLRPFNTGDSRRIEMIVTRVLAIPESRVCPLVNEVLTEFSGRHPDIAGAFLERFEQIDKLLSLDGNLSAPRKLLIGSYFDSEFSLESAALFNPSIVPHPDQSEVPSGGLRFILSLRATGEGHLSSITFRTGMIYPDGRIEVMSASGCLSEARQIPNTVYESGLFERKLQELGLANEFTRRTIGLLGQSFTLVQLRCCVEEELLRPCERDGYGDTAEAMVRLAESNYEVQFQPEQELSERIIFPASPSQRNGIEDARFVCFQNDDGTSVYYATFTAYDGRVVMPELMETSDFLHFRFITLNGPAAQNKGMAIFPRKVNGLYAMISRQDNENLYLVFSDNVHFWYEPRLILAPTFPWEMVQIGNCGSPIETDAGWLVLSHGVGPMRQYSIGAFLLDKDDPAKVIGRLAEPLLRPTEYERHGYVPNVVYTCGALVHAGQLIIPYAYADHATRFATVALDEVLGAMC